MNHLLWLPVLCRTVLFVNSCLQVGIVPRMGLCGCSALCEGVFVWAGCVDVGLSMALHITYNLTPCAGLRGGGSLHALALLTNPRKQKLRLPDVAAASKYNAFLTANYCPQRPA